MKLKMKPLKCWSFDLVETLRGKLYLIVLSFELFTTHITSQILFSIHRCLIIMDT